MRILGLGGAFALLGLAAAASCAKGADPTASASMPSCGDGRRDPVEQCDDGNTESGDGCSAECTVEGGARCGDGKLDPGEQCDDANIDPNDGCSPGCQKEAGPNCGNGELDAGEQCDDGNKTAGDGCEDNCTKTRAKDVVCAKLDPLATGTCEVKAGGAARLVIGDVLVPGTVYRGGQVLVEAAGRIACVGCDCEAAAKDATRITCPAGVVSPGLINAHDHITFTQNPPYTDTGERYEHRHDWRKGLNGHTKISSSGGASDAQISWGEIRFLMGGATSTVGSGGAKGLVRNLDRDDQEEGLNQSPVDYETFPLGDSNGKQLASGCGYPKIQTAASIAAEDAYLPHIAEGIGAFARNEFTCVSTSSGGGQDLLKQQSAFIHAVGLEAPDYAAMAKRGTALVWSPRSNVTLYGNTAVVTMAARLGVTIALGTDWMPTGSMNVLRELRCADELNRTYFGGFFSDEDLWRMVTVDAAAVTATDDAVGVLATGKVADLAVFDASARDAHRAVLDAEPKDVVLVMRQGKPLYGDADVVAALRADGACDGVDVCGRGKRVCVADEVGLTYAELKNAVGNIYPTFFCGTPDDEPTCVPSRKASVEGSTTYDGKPTAADRDGDGIPDAQDDCPEVFNPVRPLDDGKQSDFDGDGYGDACDPCPLSAENGACAGPDPGQPDDGDGDGVPNAKDNCPEVGNKDQADKDKDGKGDLCDPCPDSPNPGDAACPVPKGLVINEIDYDNVGTDTAEFVEIYNGSPDAVPLGGYALVLVNGGDGSVYLTVDLGPAGTLAPGQYLVVKSDGVTAAPGALVLPLGGSVQNGAPDGVALVDTSGKQLVDALSYEGSITSANIPGLGTVSLVEGTPLDASVADSSSDQGSLCRSPNGADTNDAATDWKFLTSPTPGAANAP